MSLVSRGKSPTHRRRPPSACPILVDAREEDPQSRRGLPPPSRGGLCRERWLGGPTTDAPCWPVQPSARHKSPPNSVIHELYSRLSRPAGKVPRVPPPLSLTDSQSRLRVRPRPSDAAEHLNTVHRSSAQSLVQASIRSNPSAHSRQTGIGTPTLRNRESTGRRQSMMTHRARHKRLRFRGSADITAPCSGNLECVILLNRPSPSNETVLTRDSPAISRYLGYESLTLMNRIRASSTTQPHVPRSTHRSHPDFCVPRPRLRENPSGRMGWRSQPSSAAHDRRETATSRTGTTATG
jgi:hypothetical protein